MACSGRDELCRSVLNDIWVSHPTWASEESGFVSHKKNVYEEALHKSEEERHEFQFYIDIITRTISLLQPLFDRLGDTGPNAMTHEEKLAFRLPADFGGPSKSIYHRAIKKVYGRDSAGLEVLQALQDSPAIAIPVVLPRLKQKNEEWRKAQREWNRVWREVDARNFYKSLDHQGITFKANDKKSITTKSFVAEIEAVKTKGKQMEELGQIPSVITNGKNPLGKASPASPSLASTSSTHLEFSFTDFAVLQDAVKLVFSFLDRSSVGYSTHERRTVERMLRAFLPILCMFSPAVATEFDAAFGPPLESDVDADGNETDPFGGDAQSHLAGHDDAGDDADDTPHASGKRSGRRSAGGHASVSGGMGGVSAGDLRKKLLKTAQEKAARAKANASNARSASASRAPSPTSDDGQREIASSTVSTTPTPGGNSGDRTKKKKGPKRKDAHPGHAHGNHSADEGTGGSRKEEHHHDSEHSAETDEWIKLMPMIGSKSETLNGNKMDVDGPEDAVVDPVSALGKHGIVDQHPFFMNTTFYTLIRLLQVSRLSNYERIMIS